MKNTKYLVKIILVSLAISVFSLIMIFSPAKDYSMSERRALKKFSPPEISSVLSGKFMTDFDDFTMDQFPLRDFFRSIKAGISRNVFRKKDNHGLYLYKGYLSKLEYPENYEKVKRNTGKIDSVYQQYIKDSKCPFYLCIIPDKNYFLGPQAGYPVMDYEKFVSDVKSQLHYDTYIDIFSTLSLEDYYKTDQHWKQEKLIFTAQKILSRMNDGAVFQEVVHSNTLEKPFYGAYYGQMSLKVEPDQIIFLENDTLNNVIVTDYNTGSPVASKVYDLNKANGRDPYEMFLCGSTPLVTIENPEAATSKELVVFRDSFGSSITPYFIYTYSKITLVDLRYIQPSLLNNFIDFNEQDILLLYSTLVLNN